MSKFFHNGRKKGNQFSRCTHLQYMIVTGMKVRSSGKPSQSSSNTKAAKNAWIPTADGKEAFRPAVHESDSPKPAKIGDATKKAATPLVQSPKAPKRPPQPSTTRDNSAKRRAVDHTVSANSSSVEGNALPVNATATTTKSSPARMAKNSSDGPHRSTSKTFMGPAVADDDITVILSKTKPRSSSAAESSPRSEPWSHAASAQPRRTATSPASSGRSRAAESPARQNSLFKDAPKTSVTDSTAASPKKQTSSAPPVDVSIPNMKPITQSDKIKPVTAANKTGSNRPVPTKSVTTTPSKKSSPSVTTASNSSKKPDSIEPVTSIPSMTKSFVKANNPTIAFQIKPSAPMPVGPATPPDASTVAVSSTKTTSTLNAIPVKSTTTQSIVPLKSKDSPIKSPSSQSTAPLKSTTENAPIKLSRTRETAPLKVTTTTTTASIKSSPRPQSTTTVIVSSRPTLASTKESLIKGLTAAPAVSTPGVMSNVSNCKSATVTSSKPQSKCGTTPVSFVVSDVRLTTAQTTSNQPMTTSIPKAEDAVKTSIVQTPASSVVSGIKSTTVPTKSTNQPMTTSSPKANAGPKTSIGKTPAVTDSTAASPKKGSSSGPPVDVSIPNTKPITQSDTIKPVTAANKTASNRPVPTKSVTTTPSIKSPWSLPSDTTAPNSSKKADSIEPVTSTPASLGRTTPSMTKSFVKVKNPAITSQIKPSAPMPVGPAKPPVSSASTVAVSSTKTTSTLNAVPVKSTTTQSIVPLKSKDSSQSTAPLKSTTENAQNKLSRTKETFPLKVTTTTTTASIKPSPRPQSVSAVVVQIKSTTCTIAFPTAEKTITTVAAQTRNVAITTAAVQSKTPTAIKAPKKMDVTTTTTTADVRSTTAQTTSNQPMTTSILKAKDAVKTSIVQTPASSVVSGIKSTTVPTKSINQPMTTSSPKANAGTNTSTGETPASSGVPSLKFTAATPKTVATFLSDLTNAVPAMSNVKSGTTPTNSTQQPFAASMNNSMSAIVLNKASVVIPVATSGQLTPTAYERSSAMSTIEPNNAVPPMSNVKSGTTPTKSTRRPFEASMHSMSARVLNKASSVDSVATSGQLTLTASESFSAMSTIFQTKTLSTPIATATKPMFVSVSSNQQAETPVEQAKTSINMQAKTSVPACVGQPTTLGKTVSQMSIIAPLKTGQPTVLSLESISAPAASSDMSGVRSRSVPTQSSALPAATMPKIDSSLYSSQQRYYGR